MNLNLRTGTTCEFVVSGPGKVNEQRERDLTGCRMSRPKASVDVGYYPNGDVGLQVKHEDEQIVNVRMARDLVVGALAEWMTRDAKDLWIELPAEDGRPIRLHQAVRIVPALQAALDRREPAVPLSEDGRPV